MQAVKSLKKKANAKKGHNHKHKHHHHHKHRTKKDDSSDEELVANDPTQIKRFIGGKRMTTFEGLKLNHESNFDLTRSCLSEIDYFKRVPKLTMMGTRQPSA